MFSFLFSKKKPVETKPSKGPIEDLDEMLNQTLEEWKARQQHLPRSEAVSCWLDRKDNMEGTTWLVRLGPQTPPYAGLDRHSVNGRSRLAK
jgi:hypothetical protein